MEGMEDDPPFLLSLNFEFLSPSYSPTLTDFPHFAISSPSFLPVPSEDNRSFDEIFQLSESLAESAKFSL